MSNSGYLVYINQSGEVVYDYTQAKYLLDVARKACRGKDHPIPEAYEKFNEKTNDGRDMSQYSELLDISDSYHSGCERGKGY